MALIVGLIGVLVGWGVTILSDWLPRFAQYLPPKLRQRKSRQLAIWQTLRGQRPDSWFLHAATEFVTGFAFATAFALYNTSPLFWVTIWGMSVFTLIVVIDFKYRLILNVVIYPMTIVFILINIFLLHQNALFVILGGVFAYSIFYATARLRPDLGMGDVKLALLIGITLGFPGVLWALLLGAGLGGIVAIYLITTGRGKRDTMIAYAPYLCFGVMVLLLLRPLFSTI